MNRFYLCIDLKTFFASVECVERGLDPFKTDLIVADSKRGSGTICLAISPKMKLRGIKNRCRVYEIPKNVKYIVAKPRMKKYIDYSAYIYSIYLRFVDKNDIHVYSIDEAFLDVTNYLKYYNLNAYQLAIKIMNTIYEETGLTATCGIGTNLYLAKIALDIISKHTKNNIGYLDEEKYKEMLWHHTPLTDFWQIGSGIEARLHKLHLKDMYDIAKCNPKLLFKEFGINAQLLIDHSVGIEPCTMKDIKNYKPISNSISNSQILFRDYSKENARSILIEMLDNLIVELVNKKLYTTSIGFSIGYSNHIIKHLSIHKKLDNPTNSYTNIVNILLEEYDYRVNDKVPIRRISVCFSRLQNKKYEQLNLFCNTDKNEENVIEVINEIKLKYGKNSILRGVSYREESTARERNKLIGGHNAI